MVDAGRIQRYLRDVARRSYETEAVPPFTAYFHPSDALVYFNYAIPDEAPAADLAAPLAALRRAFAARARTARFEYVESCFPELARALEAAGFAFEVSAHLMTCAPASLRPAPLIEGVAIEELGANATTEELLLFLATQYRAFNDQTGGDPPTDVEHFRRTLESGRAFLARLAGEAVAGGVLLPPIDGLAEVAGVGTLERHRKRGIGGAVTHAAAAAAFRMGVETVILSAGSERAGRVYARVGFDGMGAVLAYVDRAP